MLSHFQGSRNNTVIVAFTMKKVARTEIGVHTCVRGGGKDLDHRKAVEEDRTITEVSFETTASQDEKGARITVLVARERVTGMTMASVVPVKGTSGQFAAMKVLDFIKECGAAETEILLKTDQEPAIEALMADVVKTRGAALIGQVPSLQQW